MATIQGIYLNPHVSELDGSRYANENCTPATGANGANASTGGRVNKTGAQVRALIPRSAETSPSTPGWSLVDLDRAMAKLGVGFDNLSGTSWNNALSWLNRGYYLGMQGDADQFSNSTCSGIFNGDHCIGIHPARILTPYGYMRWINDPVCNHGRWEYDTVIAKYGAKLSGSTAHLRFGLFTQKVPTAFTKIAGAPSEIGPQPWNATSWVSTLHLNKIWKMDSRGICRPIYNNPNGYTFKAWMGPNISEMWAPGPKAAKMPTKAVFRRILGPVHAGYYIRVSDAGSTWHR